MLFDNTKIGFVLKSNFELEKAYFLFKIISNKTLTNFGKILLNIILTFKLPLLFIVKRTVFQQFCAGSNLEESMETVNKLFSKNVYSYLSYSVEGAQNNDSFKKSCQDVIDSIEFASDKKNIPFTVFKPTAISKTDNLMIGEIDKITLDRFDRICKKASEKNLKILIDAEESWIQDSIDSIVLMMMKKYNKQKTIVFNTVQMYRHDRLEYLKDLHNSSKQNDFEIGIKLVRGAYLEKENIIFTNDGNENIVDDYCALVAATELYKTTENHLYKKAADLRAQNLLDRLASDRIHTNYFRSDDGDRPFFHASDAGLPILSLLFYVDMADNKTKIEILHTVRKYLEFELKITNEVNNPFGYCRQYVQNKQGNRRSSFFFPHDTETAPWWQGENARLSSIAAAARLAAIHLDDPEFGVELQEHAWNQLNWILGLNPFDASMLQGEGRNNPAYLFFNTYQYQNAPGGICNGITAGLYDENDIDLYRGYTETGMDHDWRWGEQWLPHAAWYILAISASR